MSENMDILFAFYASDQEQAEQQARKIVKEQGHERLNLKAFPYGFVMHRSCISGLIEDAALLFGCGWTWHHDSLEGDARSA
jgi:hypothetical protein